LLFGDLYLNDCRVPQGIVYWENHDPDLDVQCGDEDDDGYYWWGIGPKPQTCPLLCSNNRDCDDSNRDMGAYNTIYSTGHPLYECQENCGQMDPDQTINQTTSYGGDTHFNNTLILEPAPPPAPPTITIAINGNVWMHKDAKILVKPGAKLIIGPDARITSACNQLWHGIRVFGTSDDQQEQYQGVIETYGIIENAICAIKDTVENQVYCGAIVRADGATFRNNYRAVELMRYNRSTNMSFFNDCDFTTTGKLIDNSDFDRFVTLSEVPGVSFTSSQFRMDYSCETRGIGIYAFNSTFYFDGGNYGGLPVTNFSNLVRGIYAYSSNETPGPNVIHSLFINTRRGIYISAMNGAVVKFNEFRIPVPCPTPENGGVPLPDCASRYGLYLNECRGYSVQENLFTRYPLNGEERGDIGLYIKDSGPYPNEVYKNTFTNLNFGAMASGINRDYRSNTGLCFTCNTFDGNLYDIHVNQGQWSPPDNNIGVAYYQGSYFTPAGNAFSDPVPTKRFDNNVPLANNILYSYYYLDNNQNPDPSTNVNKNSTINENSCLSEQTGEDGDSIREEHTLVQNSIDSLTSELNLIVDGGNTTSLNNQVVTSTSGQSLDLYDELMLNSPNLSDTVLNSAIGKDEVLNNAFLRDILVANPQSAKRDSLIQKLDQRIVPMPEPMKIEILEGVNYTSLREELESEICAKKTHERRIFHNLLRYYNAETSILNPEDSVKTALLADSYPQSKYDLAFQYLKEDSLDKMNETLDSIPSLFSLSLQEQVAYQDYLSFFSVLEQLDTNNLTYENLNSAQISFLESISNGIASLPAALARNMLIQAEMTAYSEPIMFPDTSAGFSGSAVAPENASGLLDDQKGFIKIFPNPGKEYVIIEYSLYEKFCFQEICLKIKDINGKPLKTIFSDKCYDQVLLRTNGFAQGIYFAEIQVEDHPVLTEKFILIK
jgi:hypothetical protein